jgi:hypothetical protein
MAVKNENSFSRLRRREQNQRGLLLFYCPRARVNGVQSLSRIRLRGSNETSMQGNSRIWMQRRMVRHRYEARQGLRVLQRVVDPGPGQSQSSLDTKYDATFLVYFCIWST